MPWKRLPPLLVTLSSNIGFLLRPSLSTSTTPPAPRVRGPMQWPIMGVRPPSPSDLVGPLRSLSLRQTLDKGEPLPSLVLSPPSSPTPTPYFVAGATSRLKERSALSVYIDEATSSLSSFFGSDEREAGSHEDISEASEGSGYGSGSGVIPEGIGRG